MELAAIDWGEVGLWAILVIVAGIALIMLVSVTLALVAMTVETVRTRRISEFAASVIGLFLFVALIGAVPYVMTRLL